MQCWESACLPPLWVGLIPGPGIINGLSFVDGSCPLSKGFSLGPLDSSLLPRDGGL